MTSEEKIEALGEALLEVVNEFTETTQMTTGEVMGALFSLFVAAAKSSAQYDPVRLRSELNEKVNEALQ
jgi:hypothetical protein